MVNIIIYIKYKILKNLFYIVSSMIKYYKMIKNIVQTNVTLPLLLCHKIESI